MTGVTLGVVPHHPHFYWRGTVQMNIPLREGDDDAGVSEQFVDPETQVAADAAQGAFDTGLTPEKHFEIKRAVTKFRFCQRKLAVGVFGPRRKVR
ncbi:MAG: hypothetical protein O2910_01135 [Proteobacteria bacterium]|nr:hypothetical protein [Pseudomonadota bacterium]